MEETKKWFISWTAIIIAFVVFWPVGFLLLYLRFTNNSGKLKTNAILLIVVAITCYFMTFVGISVTLEDLSTDFAINLFMIIFFLGGGIASTIFAIKFMRKHKCYNKYVEKIGARVKISVDELSQLVGNTREITIKNVSEAIKYKMLKGYINENDEIIIRPSSDFNINIERKQEIVTVQCKNCGANNKFIVGRENRCEFCDSVLIRQYSNVVR